MNEETNPSAGVPQVPAAAPAPLENKFKTEDVQSVLLRRGWLQGDASVEQLAWCARAAALLGTQAQDAAALEDLLGLVFYYDAREVLARVETHVVLSRYAARDALRLLAGLLLDPAPLTTEHFREVVDAMKAQLDIRGRELFHPLRVALAGRCGEGELDRVVLLLDEAAAAQFAAPVKTARARVIEFCSALD
ncbi:MAG TPA: hypothetical protein VMT51_09765 [Dongiaceae bacterium]|nr:hypothetical protein [Dongiaceae bacterium]